MENIGLVRYLIDNTGLQSASLCLDSVARSSTDVEGLLQLATLIVFGDEIALSSLSSSLVVQETNDRLSQLREFGLDDKLMVVPPMPRDEFPSICHDAARHSIDEIKIIDWNQGDPSLDLAPPIVLGKVDKLFVEFLRSIHKVDDNLMEEGINAINKNAFSDEFIRSAEFMIANNSSLREAVLHVVEKCGWDDSAIERIRTYLRSQIYMEIARRQGATYTPSVARSRNILNSSSQIADFLEFTHQVVQKISPAALPMPFVQHELIVRSKASPTGMIYEALELREQAVGIRHELHHITNDLDLSTKEGLGQAIIRLNNLTEEFEAELGEKGRGMIWKISSILEDLIGWNLVGAASKLWSLNAERLKDKRFTSLIPLARSSIGRRGSRTDLAKFDKNCGILSE